MTRRYVVPALAVGLALIAGCARSPAEEKGPAVLTRSLADVENATRTHLTEALAMVDQGEPDPAAPQIGPAPCDGPDDGRFHVTGFTHVTLPAEQHRAVLTRLRGQVEAGGYQVVGARDLAGDTGGELRLRTADDFSVNWASSGDRVWLALTVMSPCVLPPDGKYPG
ncbi:hypothetical protein [Micromonospora zhanjiangensis]|uniref:Lipoprotein n=1 Tax=Micromonospora zhanjiangensis TaxID=1522057 RepID=A0ABV8KZ13_9ACTN